MAFWLPAIGGTLGAIEGYRRGGLGGAITGGALGAVTPKGLRMAGTLLGAKLMPAAVKAGIPGALSITSKGIGNQAALWGVGLGVPSAVVGGAANIVGGDRQGQVGGYNPTQGLPAGGPMYGVTDYYNPWSSRNLGYGWQQKDFDINRRAAVDAALAMEPIIEGAKQREYLRNLSAAKYRQQIATEANLIQQGQLGAQAMGRIGAQSALGALAGNYQYR